jgi:hypothetical protein
MGEAFERRLEVDDPGLLARLVDLLGIGFTFPSPEHYDMALEWAARAYRAGQAATPDGTRRWVLPEGFEVRHGVELAHGPGWSRGYAVVDDYADLDDARSMAAYLANDPDRPTRVTRRAVGPYFPLTDATPAAESVGDVQ